jgi:hypothetical protein
MVKTGLAFRLRKRKLFSEAGKDLESLIPASKIQNR